MKKSVKLIVKIVLFLTILIVFSEYLFRSNPINVLKWIVENPILFLMNLSFLALITGLLIFISKSIDFSLWFVCTLTVILGIINASKFNLRNIPLTFEDLFLLKETWVLLPKLVNPKTILVVAFSIPLALLLRICFKRLFHGTHFHDAKTPLLSMTLIATTLLLAGQFSFTNDLDAWESGLLYSLSNNIRKDATYDEEVLELAEIEISANLKDRHEHSTPLIKPHIIIIMSESFWDVNLLDVEFSKDPLSNFRTLQEESFYGNIYVPVFGGGTANTEYEVLTGMTLKNFPYDWYVVYREAIHEPTPSLATILKTHGYHTVALHTYYPWYYRRNEVYPLMGFDDFISIDNFPESEDSNMFISDDAVTEKIIALLNKSKEPLFNFTVTMQNHGPYDDGRYDTDDNLIATTADLDEEDLITLTTYAHGLSLSDKALNDLINYLRNFSEPTLLLFFGDHLPMLGEDMKIYKETGYIEDERSLDIMEDLRVMTTPYLIWANYEIERGEQTIMNASYLAPTVLKQAGIPLPPYLNAVDNLAKNAPLITRTGFTDGEGESYLMDTDAYQIIRAMYHKLQEKALTNIYEK